MSTARSLNPELRDPAHSALDARTGIYALGVTLYHMTTGRLPFQGDIQSVLAQVLTQDPPAPRSINPSCPKVLEALILR